MEVPGADLWPGQIPAQPESPGCPLRPFKGENTPLFLYSLPSGAAFSFISEKLSCGKARLSAPFNVLLYGAALCLAILLVIKENQMAN